MRTQSHPPFSSFRQRKQVLFPQVVQLAQEGLPCRVIGERLKMSPFTASHWLRAMRLAAKKPPDPAEALQAKITYYESIAQEFYEEWLRSKADKQVRVVEETAPAGDEAAAKKKTLVRSETRTGNDALLAKSMEAQGKADAFREKLAALQGTAPAGPAGAPDLLPRLSDADLEKLTKEDLDSLSDDQLFAVESRLRAKYERQGVKFERPLLTNEELCNLSDADLKALETRVQAEVDAAKRDLAAPRTESTAPGKPEPPRCEADPRKDLAVPAPQPNRPRPGPARQSMRFGARKKRRKRKRSLRRR